MDNIKKKIKQIVKSEVKKKDQELAAKDKVI